MSRRAERKHGRPAARECRDALDLRQDVEKKSNGMPQRRATTEFRRAHQLSREIVPGAENTRGRYSAPNAGDAIHDPGLQFVPTRSVEELCVDFGAVCVSSLHTLRSN